MDPRKVFDLSFIPNSFEEFKGEDAKSIYQLLNYDIVTFIEQEHDCSGFCQSSLFYFGESIEKGPPT
jgi:hypothetical protein